VPHPIGDCALLADGRTAALLDPDGEVVWLCWPRVDSDACLLALLDPVRGGTFSLRPRGEGVVESRDYTTGLVLRTVWRQGRGRLVVDEALATDGRTGLLRMLRSEGAPVLVEVRFRPAFGFATSPATVTESGRRGVAAGGGLVLAVDAPAPWRIDEGVGVCIFKVVPGYPTAVALGDAGDAAGLGDAPERMASTMRGWRATEASVELPEPPGPLATRALGVQQCTRLLTRSAAVLIGLRQRGGGIVAAPTTSIPQGEGDGRTWDYRYAWLRDTALAGQALLRLGMVDDAHGLGAFCGDLCLETDEPPALVRVDETPAPPEHELTHLSGYGGAGPVRVGNAAAGLLQLDVAGEVLELAWDLHRGRALPESLRRAVPRLAELAARRAGRPDHGIWEVRGRPREYVHSAVLAWSGLRRAGMLASAGACSGDPAPWTAAAARIRAGVLARCRTTGLQLHERGGGPDAALSQAVLLGFLAPDDRCARATLAAIETTLVRGAGVDRYKGQPDGLAAPSAPFVFPAFWLAAAQELSGLDGAPRFAAAASAAGPLALFGEVVDPGTGAPLGNYPQVQSHAAFVLAAAGPAPSALSP
jgi:GH15 family glucan-1,4-alpha-glucosidase